MTKKELKNEVDRLTDALSDANGDIETLEQRNRELENINKVLEKTASSLMHNSNKLEQFNRELVEALEKIRDFNDDNGYDDPGQIAIETLSKHSAPAGQKGGDQS